MENSETIINNFKQEIKNQRITLHYIKLHTGYSLAHTHYVLKNIRPLSDQFRAKLNALLNTNF
jgi:hypothetical protein